jgi:hypothetical protein
VRSIRSLVRSWHRFGALMVLSLLLVTSAAQNQIRGDGLALSASAEQQAFPQVIVVAVSADEIVVEASIPPVHLGELVENGVTYQRLYLSGTGTTSTLGRPELPSFGRFFAVPVGATLQVEILEETPANTPLEQREPYRVFPAQPPQADQGLEPPFVLDAGFYEQDAYYPSQTVTVDEVTTLRGINVSLVRFTPVQYNPARGELRVFSRLRARISFPGGTGRFIDQRLWSPYLESTYQQLLLNYPLLEAEVEQAAGASLYSTAAVDGNGADLLIITAPDFIEPANTLADWKRRKGIDTAVRTTAQTGTTRSAIRNYILNAYVSWNPPPSFVLLLGDAEYIPTHDGVVHPWACTDCWYPSGTRIATDLYYGDMSGNYFPELALGRIPVDTADQAAAVVNKIVEYERNPPSAAGFYSNAMVAAYFQDYNRDHYDERRFVRTSEEIREFLLAQGYAVDRVYYTEDDVVPTHHNDGQYGNGEPLPPELLKPGFAWDGWTDDIQRAIDAGRFLVAHRDHGMSRNNGHSATEGWWAPRWRATDVADLTNGSALPVVFSVNCETGWFDGETDFNAGYNNQSLAEALLLQPAGGAVGVIGATRVTFSGYNDYMIRGFIDAIWPDFIPDWGSATPEYRLGNILNIGKLSMAHFWSDPEGYQTVQFEDFHYFGDPTMEIWTALPVPLSVAHPTTLRSGSSVLTVNVDQDGALVSLVKDGAILATSNSEGGRAVLSFNPVSAGSIYVTATKHNYLPYEGSISVLALPESVYLPLAIK